jgi:hypothetical protein
MMRDLITTCLEVIGILLIAAAAGLAVGVLYLPGGIAAAGVLLIGASFR